MSTQPEVNAKWYRRAPGAIERWEEIELSGAGVVEEEGDMSEDLREKGVAWIKRNPFAADANGLIYDCLEEIDRLRAELATAQDLLGQVARDDTQGLIELGAARQREADAVAVKAWAEGGTDARSAVEMIRESGLCLTLFPDETRLREVEKAARQMVDVAGCSWEEAADELRRTLKGEAFSPLT